jgi:hypothetical protein
MTQLRILDDVVGIPHIQGQKLFFLQRPHLTQDISNSLILSPSPVIFTMFTAITSNARTSAARASLVRHRMLHSTPVTLKTVTEKVSEVADKVR